MSDIECIRLQNEQFKALSCIYLDEFHATKDSSPQKFNITCKPYIGNESQYQISIIFEFTPSYPKSPLKYQVQPITGITRDNLQEMITNIQNILYQNRNRPIVYDIVQQTRFWIHQYLVEGKAYRQEEIQEVYKKKQEIFERPKFAAFTPVTQQSFLAWKRQFQLKVKAVKKQKKQGQLKPTGKQWFLGKKEQDQDDQQDSQDQEYESDQEEQVQAKVQAPRDDVQNNDIF